MKKSNMPQTGCLPAMVVCATLLIASGRAQAVTNIILQQGLNGYTGAEDTYLFGNTVNRTNNYGGATSLISANNAVRFFSFTALKFDLASIAVPSNDSSNIANATLSIHLNDSSVGINGILGVYEVLSAFDVGTSVGAIESGAASHKWRITGTGADGSVGATAWGTALNGPLGGTDYDATPAATDAVIDSGNAEWLEFDVTDLVRDWYDTPAVNHGVFIQNTNFLATGNYNFDSSDFATVSLRPMLELTIVPETSSVFLLILGGVMARYVGRRKRR